VIKRFLWSSVIFAFFLAASGPASAAVVSVGTFPDLAPAPAITIPPGTFLVPVQISGAINLQNWQFDLLFDNTVVEVVDPFDGSSGIYGAEFVPGEAATASFILGGFPLNGLGLVDDVAGFYPALLAGPSGSGILAYILFGFLPDQDDNDPGFRIENAIVLQVPQASALLLLAAGSALLRFASGRRGRSRWPAGGAQ
jgi:hypothetical protein